VDLLFNMLNHLAPLPMIWRTSSLEHFRRKSLGLTLIDLAIHRHSLCNQTPNISNVTRNNNCSTLLSKFPERIDILLRDTQTDRSLRSLTSLCNRAPHSINTRSRSLSLQQNCFSLSARPVDLLAPQGLRSQNDALFLALSNVDCALPLALGLQNL